MKIKKKNQETRTVPHVLGQTCSAGALKTFQEYLERTVFQERGWWEKQGPLSITLSGETNRVRYPNRTTPFPFSAAQTGLV